MKFWGFLLFVNYFVDRGSDATRQYTESKIFDVHDALEILEFERKK
jgi:hypothetical protein